MPTTITISEFQIPDCNFLGTSVRLRRYYDQDWTDVDGVFRAEGVVGSSTGFFDEISCTLSANTITVPAFPATPTDNAQIGKPSETWQLWDQSGSPRNIIFEGFIPSANPTITFGALQLINKGQTLFESDAPTRLAQWIQSYINTVIGVLRFATSVIAGWVRLSVPAANVSDPVAVGDNDPRIPAFTVHTSKYASLNAAITAITSLGGGTVVIDSSTTVSANVATTASIALSVQGQGQLTGSSKTVTIVGPFDAPSKQVFGSGVTASWAGNKTMWRYDPRWWEVTGDGTTDDTTAWVACIASVPDYSTILLPSNFQSKITSTLTFTSRHGLILTSAASAFHTSNFGADGTSGFLWYGAANGTMVNLVTTPSMIISGLGFAAKPSTNGADFAIKITSTGAEGDIQILHNFIQYNGQSSTFEGIAINPTGASGNCENITIANNTIYGSNDVTSTNTSRGTGIHLGPNANIKGITISNNWILACYRGIYQQGGWFYAGPVNFATYNTFDVYSTGCVTTTTIEGLNSEQSNQIASLGSGRYRIVGGDFANWSTVGSLALTSGCFLEINSAKWSPSGDAPTDAATVAFVVTGNVGIISQGNAYLNRTNTVSGFAACTLGASSYGDGGVGGYVNLEMFGPSVGSGSSAPGAIKVADVANANLVFPLQSDGTIIYSSDTRPGSAAGSGAGALLARINGAFYGLPISLFGVVGFDPGNLADGASATTTVTVAGAATSDIATAAFSSITAVGWQISAQVISANTVAVAITNHTGGAVDLPSGLVRVNVFKT